MTTHATESIRRGSTTQPCPGYAHTREASRHVGATEGRDSLVRYAALLVRLNLTPAWGVRMYHHRVSARSWVYVIMLDGPDPEVPAALAIRARLMYTTPPPPPPHPHPDTNGRPVADVVAFL